MRNKHVVACILFEENNVCKNKIIKENIVQSQWGVSSKTGVVAAGCEGNRADIAVLCDGCGKRLSRTDGTVHLWSSQRGSQVDHIIICDNIIK